MKSAATGGYEVRSREVRVQPADIPAIFPDILLIVGSDAAGKDYVANLVQRLAGKQNLAVEKRAHLLSGKTISRAASARKTCWKLLLERIFLTALPYSRSFLPPLLRLLLEWDLKHFRAPEEKLIVVGHNWLRGLALSWGHRSFCSDQTAVSPALASTLARLRALAGLHVIVLQVDEDIRADRISRRAACGEADYFDHYMVASPERSARIQKHLIWLCQKYLGAQLICNNDLAESQLRTLILAGFAGRAAGKPPLQAQQPSTSGNG